MSASSKNSFVLYLDQQDLFNKLPDDIAGKLIKHIFSYVNCEDPETDDFIVEVAFSSIKQALKRDLKKWEKQKKQRSDAGKKSAEKREEEKQRAANEKQRKATGVESRSTNPTVSVSVSGSVSGSENVGVKDQKTLSGKPDGAVEVINYLNLKTGSNYQPVEANTKLVIARISEGRTIGEIKSVIDRQCLEWPPGHKQRKYLRPATLFNTTKFNQYFGQIGQPINLEQQNGQQSKSAYQQRVEAGDERSFNIDTNF